VLVLAPRSPTRYSEKNLVRYFAKSVVSMVYFYVRIAWEYK
jgi:hypothetical protein